MFSWPWLPLVLPLVAAIPGLVVWWHGRRLARHAAEDDAVLAERMQGAQRRTAAAMTAATVALILLGGWHAVWTLPLMVLLAQAADYPARRKIHAETWSLARYLSFTIRSTAALGGFWLLLAVTPWLVHFAGSAATVAAAFLAALLLVWNARFQAFTLFLFRATPLDDPALAPAFADVISRAAVPMPRVWHADPGGGLAPAAFALPSLRGGAVLFLRPLLDRLAREEVVAIFAHEVAHLEQFTPRVLRRLTVESVAMILSAVLLVPVTRSIDGMYVPLAALVWPFVVLLFLAWRTRAHQPLELAGDRRAAELCGNPEAVAAGLVKLYALTRMPRRLDVDVERWASHPSLARRVQALRAASAPVVQVDEPMRLVSADGGRVVTFERDGLRLSLPGDSAPPVSAGIATSELLAYPDLHELRLEFRGRSPVLIARDRKGRLVRTEVRAEDVARVHAVLDRVDGLLAPDLPRSTASSRGRLLAIAAALLALFSPAAIVSVLAAALPSVIGPGRVTLAAAAAASVGGGAWLTLTRTVASWPVIASALIGLGVATAWFAVRTWHGPNRRDRVGAAVLCLLLAVAAACAWTLVFALPGGIAWRLHQSAFTTTGVIVFPLALAAALAVSGGAARRLAALAAAVVAVVPVAAATDWFVNAAVQDPLILPAPVLRPAEGAIDVAHRLTVPAGAGDVQVSPGGRWVSSVLYDESEDAHTADVLLTSIDGVELRAVAEHLVLLDDARALVANESADGVRLSLHRLEEGLPEEWSVTLPRILVMSLAASSREGRWRVTGWGDNEGVRFEGRLHDMSWQEQRWRNPDPETYSVFFAGSGDHALWLGSPATFSIGQAVGDYLVGNAIAAGASANHIAVTSARGETKTMVSELSLGCVPPPIVADAVACSAYDGRTTRVYRIGGSIQSVARVPGAIWLWTDDADGTLVGMGQGEYVLVRTGSGQIVRIAAEGEGWGGLTYAGGHVGRGPSIERPGAVEVGRIVMR